MVNIQILTLLADILIHVGFTENELDFWEQDMCFFFVKYFGIIKEKAN